jgi:hypothetical protein
MQARSAHLVRGVLGSLVSRRLLRPESALQADREAAKKAKAAAAKNVKKDKKAITNLLTKSDDTRNGMQARSAHLVRGVLGSLVSRRLLRLLLGLALQADREAAKKAKAAAAKNVKKDKKAITNLLTVHNVVLARLGVQLGLERGHVFRFHDREQEVEFGEARLQADREAAKKAKAAAAKNVKKDKKAITNLLTVQP